MHPGYVRNYERSVRMLLDDGHEVHVAFTNRTKQWDDRVAERMSNEYLKLSVGRAPKSTQRSVDNLRRALRSLADYARYQHPRFRDAGALRERAGAKLLKRRGGRGLFPAVALTLYLPTLGRIRSAHYADAVAAVALRLANGLPPPERPTAWLRGLAPDVFLTTPHVAIGSSDPEFLDAARALGIPSAVLIASWDNLTNKGLIKSAADLVVVWNEAQRTEAVELHNVAPERVAVTGAQRFDDWFEISASSDRDAFLDRIGLDPGEPYILYLCSSPFIAPDEVPFVRRVIEALRTSDGPLASAGVLIRPHPQNAKQWTGTDLGEYGNVVIWPRAGEQPVRAASKQTFYDSIHHSMAVVGINTSAQIEAGILGRTVHTVLDPDFASAHEGTLHFKYLLVENGGLLYVADDLPHLVRNLESVLTGELSESHTARFVENFVRPHGSDRPASAIVADTIRQLMDGPRRSAVKPTKLTARERALVVPLSVLSFPTTPGALTGAVIALWHRLLKRARGLAVGGLRQVLSELLRRLPAAPTRLDECGPPAMAGNAPGLLVIEPWPGDLVSEILYWIPSVRRYRRTLPWETRVIVVTNGSDPRWYATLGPEALVDQGELGFEDGWSPNAFRALLVDDDDHVKPRFYGPNRGCAALVDGLRSDALSWNAFDKATDLRLLRLRPTTAGRAGGTVDWARARPTLGDDLVLASEGDEAIAVVQLSASLESENVAELVEVDVGDRVALSTALENAAAAITTDIGVAALAVSLGVTTTFVRGPGAHDADVDVLDRVAVGLEVDLEIIEARALRMVLAGERTRSPR